MNQIKPIIVPIPEPIPEPVPDQASPPLPAPRVILAQDSRPLARIEQNVGLLAVVIVVLVSLGGLADHASFCQRTHGCARAGAEAVRRAALAGRDVYVREPAISATRR